MAKETQKNLDGIDIDELGITQAQEQDRFPLAARGAMSITRIRFDYKTKYWDEKTKTGTPITKFDGFDTATGERVKYFTVSDVIYKQMTELVNKVGVAVQKDENGVEWMILKKSVNTGGFEEVSTGVKGRNPYFKILPVHS